MVFAAATDDKLCCH